MNSPRAEAAARLLPGRIRAAAAGVQGKAGEDQTPVEARGTWRAGTAMEKGTCLSSSPFEAERRSEELWWPTGARLQEVDEAGA